MNHLLNFAAPALVMAAAMPLLSRLVHPKAAALPSWRIQFLVHLGSGLAVLVAGLWLWERDGKMASYATMVLVCGSAQWFMQKGWRR